MLYLPSGQYPEQGWGGTLERIDDWAYVHEQAQGVAATQGGRSRAAFVASAAVPPK
jgi:hypothetical protein